MSSGGRSQNTPTEGGVPREKAKGEHAEEEVDEAGRKANRVPRRRIPVSRLAGGHENCKLVHFPAQKAPALTFFQQWHQQSQLSSDKEKNQPPPAIYSHSTLLP